MENFKNWPKMKQISKDVCQRGDNAYVYVNTETNKGFEQYSGQLIDAFGNVVATILTGEPLQIKQKLIKISKIRSEV